MTKTTKLRFVAITLIVILGLIAYGNTLKNGFVYDDPLVVEGNTFITSLSNLRHFFDDDYYLGSGETSWRVVVTLSYFIDYQLWQFKPFGYHLTNLIFHLLNGILFYVFLLLLIPIITKSSDLVKKGILTDYFSLPLIAALIFISHPVQSEAVNSVGFRHEVVFSFFFFAALIFYLKKISTAGIANKVIFYILSLICYLLSMLSKEMGMVLPLVIISIEFLAYLRDRTSRFLSRMNILVISGYVLILGIYVWIRFFWLVLPEEKIKTIFYGAPFLGGSVYTCILTTMRIFASYLRLFSLPIHLKSEYVISISHSLWEPRVLFSLFILVTIFTIIVASVKRYPLVSFSGFWIFIPLITVSNIVPLHHPMAERYIYLSTAGFSIFLAYVIFKLRFTALSLFSDRYIKGMVAVFLILLFTLYAIRATSYLRLWKDKPTFWKHIVLDNPPPHRPRSYSCLGQMYFNEGNYDQAEVYFKKSLRQGPYYPNAHSNLGLLYCEKGDWDKGIEHFKKVISLAPSLIKAYSNLGLAYLETGRTDEAIKYYKKAIEMNPYLAEPYSNLGQAYLVKNDPDKAIENFKKVLQLNPHMSRVYSNLGRAYWVKGDIKEAVNNYKKALKLDPNLDKAYSNLAQAYAAMGMLDGAIDNYKMALKLNPTEFKSNFRLGLVYLEKGLFDESIREFKKVLEITPDFGPAYYNLAIIYHRIGDYNSAVEYCDKAKEVGFDEIGPDFLKVLEPYR